MAAAVIAVRNNRHYEDCGERRKTALDDRDKFWKDLEEQAHFKDMLKTFDADKSGDLDAKELCNLIQKFGKGIYIDSEGRQLDLLHSGAGQHYPSSPTEEEITWILAAVAKVKSNRIVASELKFALVCANMCLYC